MSRIPDSEKFDKNGRLHVLDDNIPTPEEIAENAFNYCTNLTTLNVPWASGAVAGAPWGATKATINYNYVG